MGVRAWCVTAVLVLAVVVTAPPTGPLQARGLSPIRSLAGNWGFSFVGQGLGSQTPSSGVGVVVLDDHGGLTGFETFSDGTHICEVTLAGTWTLQANGTGRITLGADSPATGCSFQVRLTFIVLDHGNRLKMISLEPGFVVINEEFIRRPEY
jgi:hypothetical protein